MADIKTFGHFEVDAGTTTDDLYERLCEELREVLEDDVCEDDLFGLLNEYREANGYDELKTNDDYTVNDELSGLDPIDILRCAGDWDECDDYLISNGYGDFETTNDVWHGVDSDAVAEWIADKQDAHGVGEVEDLLDEYHDAVEAVEELEEEEEERKAREEEEAKQRERRAEEARLIKSLVMITRQRAHEFAGDNNYLNEDGEEVARLTLAVMELFDKARGEA